MTVSHNRVLMFESLWKPRISLSYLEWKEIRGEVANEQREGGDGTFEIELSGVEGWNDHFKFQQESIRVK